MNRYDALPTSIKAIALLMWITPVVIAGYLTGSWWIFVATFIAAFVLNLIGLSIAGKICAHVHRFPDGEYDAAAWNECFIWPFLAVGPVCTSLSAWYFISYGFSS